MDFQSSNNRSNSRRSRSRSRHNHNHNKEYCSPGSEDEDEDDDAVIVYKETPTAPWALSQMSVTSTLSIQRQKEKQKQQQQEEEDRQFKENEHVSTMISRKRSGRRNRCRPFHSREQHLFNDHEPAIEYDHNNSDDEDVDVFASLRPMMVQLSQEQRMKLCQQPQHSSDIEDGKIENRCIDNGGSDNLDGYLSGDNDQPKVSTKAKKTSLPSLEKENKNGQDSNRKSISKLKNSSSSSNISRIKDNKSSLPVEVDDNDRSKKQLMPLSVELNNKECSPPDFDICVSNDFGEDENNTEFRRRDIDQSPIFITRETSTRRTNFMDMNQNKKRSSSDRTNNNKEKRRRKQGLRNVRSDRTSPVDTCGSNGCGQVDASTSTKRRLRQDTKTASFATTTTTNADSFNVPRTHRVKRTDKSRHQHRFSPSKIEKKQQKHSPRRSPTDVENVKKSIVGIRPTHWSRNSRGDQNRRVDSKGKKSLHQLAKPSALAAATRTPFTVTNGKKKKNAVSNGEKGKSDNNSACIGGDLTTITINKSSYSNNIPSSKNGTDVTNGEVKKSSFSFAPSFVPTKSIASIAASLNNEAVGDDSGDECRTVTSKRLAHANTNINPFVTTPPYAKRRRAKPVTGEWGRRLILIRNSRSNDSVRLRNQAFARRRMYDLNDPRKRAKTFTDVTIMGSYNGPWINLPEDMKITVLGYMHRHIQRNKNSTKGNNHPQNQKHCQETKNIISQDCFAWFTFTLATARCINLERACKLRIYNAVVLPCRMPMTLDLPPTSFGFLRGNSGGSNSKNVRCEKIVICTHLCERIDRIASSSQK